jgi:hypothetical protein
VGRVEFVHNGKVQVVLAMGRGYPQVVHVQNTDTSPFGWRPILNPSLLHLGSLNRNLDTLTCTFSRVALHPVVSISGFVFRVFSIWLHSDILQLIANYW